MAGKGVKRGEIRDLYDVPEVDATLFDPLDIEHFEVWLANQSAHRTFRGNKPTLHFLEDFVKGQRASVSYQFRLEAMGVRRQDILEQGWRFGQGYIAYYLRLSDRTLLHRFGEWVQQANNMEYERYRRVDRTGNYTTRITRAKALGVLEVVKRNQEARDCDIPEEKTDVLSVNLSAL